MSAIDFVIRTGAGNVERGVVQDGQSQTTIQAGVGREVSLNLTQSDMRGYFRDGDKLVVTLADGRVVVLDDYFASNGAQVSRLFLSSDGALNEVSFDSSSNGVLFANYGPTAEWGKWSPDDDLIFFDRPQVVAGDPNDDNVSMLANGLLGGTGLLWPAVAGGAAVAAIAAGDDDDGGNGGGGAIVPTLDTPTDDVVIGGDDSEDQQSITVGGTGATGSTVSVTIGDETIETEVGEDGTWEVVFEDDTFPGDGEHDITATVVDPDGETHDLTGPDVTIDLTPPDITITDGTVSVPDLTNAEDYVDGVEVGGTGEPGATVQITANEVTHVTTVAEDGTWGIVFAPGELPEGEITIPAVIVTTDSFGNSHTVNDEIQIDTIPHPITINHEIIGGEGTVNEAENAAGFTITGTSTAGAVLEIVVGTYMGSTTVAADGTWVLNIPAGELDPGEYEVTVSASTVDAAGNASSHSETFMVDTVNMVDITSIPVEGENVVNATEASDGFTLTGTTQAGATVMVTVGTATLPAFVGADGTWTVDFGAADIAPGEYDVTIHVTSTDLAGNVVMAAHDIHVDTITNVTLDANLAGDGMVNAAEAQVGVPVTGTSQPGNTIEMTFNGASYTGVTGPDGVWTIMVPSSGIADGTYEAQFQVTATDGAGNTATTSGSLDVDTQGFVTVATAIVEGDGMVNAAEHADGVVITGTTEPGSAVNVTVGSVTHAASVDAAGNWTVTFAPQEFPTGETVANVTAEATDAAGNVSTASGTVDVDTLTDITIDTGLAGGDDLINGFEAQNSVAITGTTQPGNAVEMTFGGVTYSGVADISGNWSILVPAAGIPPGTYNAVIDATSTDAVGNVSATTGSLMVDTENFVTVDTDTVETDGVVNAVEHADGVVLTGTTEPGSAVTVSVGAVTHTAVVDAAGNWTAMFAPSEFPTGETVADVSAVSVDAAGNTSTATGTIDVDTFVRNHAITSTPGGDDGVLNGAEAAQGMVFSGTTEPGSSVIVEFGGTSLPATVDGSGNWTVTFPANAVEPGTRSETVSATATDPAGNVDTVTANVSLDTDVDGLTLVTPVESDDVVNMVEASDGVTLTGTVEIGAAVTVEFAGVTLPATVDAAGNWSVFYSSAQVAEGEYPTSVIVNATDEAGNMASLTHAVEVDTFVNALAMNTAPVTSDDIVNKAEADAGITLTGIVEAGSTVTLTFEGTPLTASVDASGNWTVDIPQSAIPHGTYAANVVIDATDAAGNTKQITETIAVDTEAPAPTEIATYTEDFQGNVIGIAVDASDDAQDVFQIQADGSITGLPHSQVDVAALDQTSMFFDDSVPDGSHLVVTTTDDAGNSAGTYLVLDENGTQAVDVSNPNLSGYNIEAIDLQFADESELTITDAQLTALSPNSDELKVYGGADDQVTITGATHAGQVTENGETFNVYDLGNSTVKIEDDVTNVVI